LEKARRSVLAKGESIRQARLAKGWRAEDLARKAGYSKRTIENAESGKPIDMSTVADIATALGVDYASLLPSDLLDRPNLVRFQLSLEFDARQIEHSPHLQSFFDLLQRISQSDAPVRLQAVRQGSVILLLDMEEEGFLRLTALFPEFHEHAREAIAQTPEGKAYFRGEEHASATQVEWLLAVVESVRELRIQTREYHEPQTRELEPLSPAPTAEVSPDSDDEYATYLAHLRETLSANADWSVFDALEEDARMLPSPQSEHRLRAITTRKAEIIGEKGDSGEEMQ
jgi:transcriptional regulator with XRE-family HTH domain